MLSEICKSERPQQDSRIQQAKSSSDVTVEEDQFTKTTTGLDSPLTVEDSAVKVLGQNWDTLCNELSIHRPSFPISKGSVLKVRANIFDPMGRRLR